MKKKKKSKKNRKGEFSNTRLYDLLLVIFRENSKKKLNYKQVGKILKVKEMGVKIQIIDVMKDMVLSGVLEETQRGAFRLKEKTSKIITTIKNTNQRGVYADIDDENEVFIPKEYSQFALAGDEVEVLLFIKRKKKQEGEVVSVIKRKKTEFVGVIDNSSSNYFLITDDRRVSFDVFIPPKSVRKEYLNKKVLVKVEGWNENYKNPIGKVVEIIGKVDDHNTEINSILYDYGFASKFPKEVEKSANSIAKKISVEEIKNRLDLRKTTTFTIDPKDAKDFDDALSVKKLTNGNWEIGVHIADVSHYVKKGGIIDKEAVERATSVYLVDRVIPMLPEILSNNICSLKPNVDRLAYSVLFEMDEKANLVDYKIAKTVIHSDVRFTYQTAQDVIDNKKGEFSVELLLLDKLSKQYSFEIPKSMLENENKVIWDRFLEDKKAGVIDAADKGKKDSVLKKEYSEIAERRVRLGLLLAEIGDENKITVTDDEIKNAVMQEARKYPGEENKVIEFYQKNPEAANAVRAPIFEEKVVDHIINKCTIKDIKVSAEKLFEDNVIPTIVTPRPILKALGADCNLPKLLATILANFDDL